MSKKSNVNCLTDEQWLEVYHAIRKQRLDISKFELLDDFEWGAAGPYWISKYLRDVEGS